MEEYAEKGFNLDWSRGRQIEREAGGRTGRSEKDERETEKVTDTETHANTQKMTQSNRQIDRDTQT